MATTIQTLDEKVIQTREFLEGDFCEYENSPDNPEQRKIALHKLNTALFVLGPLLPNNTDLISYEDLRLKFIGTLFDPLHQTDPAVQEVKAEFYSYLDAII